MNRMTIFETYDYAEARQFFSKKATKLLCEAIKKSNYSFEDPLDVLLKCLDDKQLFCYIWKDTYGRAYIFDEYDKRQELKKSWQYAKDIVSNPELKQQYVNNHDDFVKQEYAKEKSDIINRLVE